jgi:peptide/nickel transport system ATP-binding protein
VAQDPSAALNPGFRLKTQIGEMARSHEAGPLDDLLTRKLSSVRLPSTPEFADRYPHQLSGGQQQRFAIAIALSCDPAVAVLDEPTTGLDVVTQAHILEELRRIRDQTGVAMVYVSHDLAVVSEVADRVLVMYAGRLVEAGDTRSVLRRPRHPYTRGIVSSVPDHLVPRRLHGMPGTAADVRGRPAVGCPFAPRCPQQIHVCTQSMPEAETVASGHLVRCYRWHETPELALGEPIASARVERKSPLLAVERLEAAYRTRGGVIVAASGISFDVAYGESVALVGESGSGKTTIARCIAGLHPFSAGRIALDGRELANRARERNPDARRRIQIVFQNPNESLNPRHSVQTALVWPLRRLRRLGRVEAAAESSRLLEAVRLPAALAARFPRELSGGERQRVAIARALAAGPDLLVCDEITSALDVSVQATILELLTELRNQFSLSLLFISHDLGVVAAVAERTLVLDRGILVEQGETRGLLRQPAAEYTRALLAAAPRLDPLEHAALDETATEPR